MTRGEIEQSSGWAPSNLPTSDNTTSRAESTCWRHRKAGPSRFSAPQQTNNSRCMSAWQGFHVMVTPPCHSIIDTPCQTAVINIIHNCTLLVSAIWKPSGQAGTTSCRRCNPISCWGQDRASSDIRHCITSSAALHSASLLNTVRLCHSADGGCSRFAQLKANCH